MGEAKRRKDLGLYPEQTKKPVRKPKRQIEREIMNELFSIPLIDAYYKGVRRMRK